ncbi:MAG: hypothetical protein ACMUIM_05435 [bacterium]
MKRCFTALLIIGLLVFWGGLVSAQFPFRIGASNPWMFFGNYWGPFSMLPPLLPLGPVSPFGLRLRPTFPLLSPLSPMLRQARATVTIFFNPTLSVIQVTVLPLTTPTVAAPVIAPTAIAPTAIAPTLAPTALLFLPLLTGLGTTTPNVNLNSTVGTPNVNVLSTAPTGLSALLPII